LPVLCEVCNGYKLQSFDLNLNGQQKWVPELKLNGQYNGLPEPEPERTVFVSDCDLRERIVSAHCRQIKDEHELPSSATHAVGPFYQQVFSSLVRRMVKNDSTDAASWFGILLRVRSQRKMGGSADTCIQCGLTTDW
jgi:hypothetical protein